MRTRTPAPAPAADTSIQHRTGPADSGDKSIIGNDLRFGLGRAGCRHFAPLDPRNRRDSSHDSGTVAAAAHSYGKRKLAFECLSFSGRNRLHGIRAGRCELRQSAGIECEAVEVS